MQLGGQAACGVYHHHVAAPRFASADSVIADSRWVTTVLADDLYAVAVSPHAQLLACCSTKSIGSG